VSSRSHKAAEADLEKAFHEIKTDVTPSRAARCRLGGEGAKGEGGHSTARKRRIKSGARLA